MLIRSTPTVDPFFTGKSPKNLNLITNRNSRLIRKYQIKLIFSCVLEQNDEMARLILRLGADPETRDEEGRSPIHVAAWQGTDQIVALLLEYGASADSTDNEGRTALQNAAWQNHDKVVRILATAGANLAHSCHQGATPLCVAAQER